MGVFPVAKTAQRLQGFQKLWGSLQYVNCQVIQLCSSLHNGACFPWRPPLSADCAYRLADTCTVALCACQEIDEAVEEAKKSAVPPIEDLWNNIYVAGLGARLRPIEVGRPPIILPD